MAGFLPKFCHFHCQSPSYLSLYFKSNKKNLLCSFERCLPLKTGFEQHNYHQQANSEGRQNVLPTNTLFQVCKAFLQIAVYLHFTLRNQFFAGQKIFTNTFATCSAKNGLRRFQQVSHTFFSCFLKQFLLEVCNCSQIKFSLVLANAVFVSQLFAAFRKGH